MVHVHGRSKLKLSNVNEMHMSDDCKKVRKTFHFDFQVRTTAVAPANSNQIPTNSYHLISMNSKARAITAFHKLYRMT